jgi:glycosyltransferase involved in cell wall biosynthesis
MGERLSVVHLCAPAHVGGLERVVQGLSRGLAARGHGVTVVAVVEKGADTGPLFDPIRAAGVRTLSLEMGARAYLRERREIGALLSDLRPHVLHTHGYRPDLLHGDVARRLGIATVTTLHGSSRMGGLSHLFEWIQERALRRFDAVIAVSRPLVDVLAAKGVPRDRIHYVPNGWVPPESPEPRPAARTRLGLPLVGPPVIGWVGRLIPIKGADIFLRALHALAGAEWQASIVGDGPERQALQSLAGELRIGHRVRFHGAVPDASTLFAAFDAFVLSSRSEGTPMVLLEALGFGLPVVAAAVGGVGDVLDGDHAGWLAPPEDPEALARAIASMLDQPGEAAARGVRGRARARDRYGTDAWIVSHERVYSAGLAVRPGAGSPVQEGSSASTR